MIKADLIENSDLKERLNDGNNNGQLRIATPHRVAHAKPQGPKLWRLVLHILNIS